MVPLMYLSPPSRLHPPSSPSQLRPPPDPPPPPCTLLHVPLEAPSPPEPPDPPDSSSNPVLLKLFDTSLAFSQTIFKSLDLESLLLNLDFGISVDVVSLGYVGDTSFASKRLLLAVCSLSLCRCVDSGSHNSFSGKIIYLQLQFIKLVKVFVAITGGSFPHSLLLNQGFSQKSLSLFFSNGLISLVWHIPFVCPFTVLYSSTFVVFKSFCVQLWQLNGLMFHISIHPVDRVLSDVYYYSGSLFMELVSLPISSTTLCGFGAGSLMLKIRDTSNTEVLIKGCLAMLKIVNCALAAVSISGSISLSVVSNSQGFVSLVSCMVVEFRGLLYIISCLSVVFAPIFMCCICFHVIVVSLAKMAMLSGSVNTFSILGE
ncbi:unnamed protein product [Eruca vesicaria subsp. sativa]|uniref:Uncharacterized protein n=1 Tax=Eruca vesicaria subsp. sativa TaxID=29727 RepID=A0ABC8J768_ERUVS|nr:unnamed protein product [Eruca vesicaria subsp. sativa]